MNTQVHPYENSENLVGTMPALFADQQKTYQILQYASVPDFIIHLLD